jgi:predicted nuclease of predicted toxin-antitoxin system
MHIKVDEDLPQSVATVLRQRGYSCSTVLEQGKGGWKDPALWEVVQDSLHGFLAVASPKGLRVRRRSG